MNKTIYVRDEDVATWEKAKDLAGDKLSPIIAAALRRFVAQQEAAAQGFDAARWDEFRRLGQELCERMLMHVQKEEMALLPLLEETMDAETEARLYEDYVEKT